MEVRTTMMVGPAPIGPEPMARSESEPAGRSGFWTRLPGGAVLLGTFLVLASGHGRRAPILCTRCGIRIGTVAAGWSLLAGDTLCRGCTAHLRMSRAVTID